MSFSITKWPDGVFTNHGRNNKYFGIMDDERLKFIAWAFYNDFLSLDQTDNINCSMSVMFNLFGEPVPAGFNEFKLV